MTNREAIKAYTKAFLEAKRATEKAERLRWCLSEEQRKDAEVAANEVLLAENRAGLWP